MIFFAAKRDPTIYIGPGNGALGWKLFEMHLKLGSLEQFPFYLCILDVHKT